MNKKVILAILSVVIILVASGIGIYTGLRKSNSEKILKIYFLNKTSTDIVTEEREVEGEGNKLLDALVEEILKGPDSGKNKPVVGKNTTVISKKKTDTYLTIDFSKEFLRESPTENMLSVYAIARTLCQVEKVTDVMVTVEGEPVKTPDGATIGYLKNNDINLENDTFTNDSKHITLYFAKKDGSGLAKEVRTIKITDTKPIEWYVITELIKGPVNKDLAATLSQDTELMAVETAKSTCHITFKNFIEKNMSKPDSFESELAVYSVVNSLLELEDIGSVRFLFDGKTTEMVGKFNFAEDFKKNSEIVK